MLAGGPHGGQTTIADETVQNPAVAIVPHGDLPRRPAALALPPGCPAARWRSIGWLFLTGRGQYNTPVPVDEQAQMAQCTRDVHGAQSAPTH